MGGEELTQGEGYTYEVSQTPGSMAVTIAEVTGPVVITAVGVPQEYAVAGTLDKLAFTGGKTASHGSPYTAVLSASEDAEGYALPESVSVTMGSAPYTGFTYDPLTGALYIPSVTGEIKITASAAAAQVNYTVEHYLENIGGGYPSSPERTTIGTANTGSTLNALPAESFEGSTLDEKAQGTTSLGTAIAGNGSTVFKLYYTRNAYEISLTEGYSWPDGTKRSWKYEEEVRLALPAVTGHEAASWEATQAGSAFTYGLGDDVRFTMPAGNVTISPSYAPISLTVSRAGLDKVDFTGEPSTTYGQEFAATLVADTGYALPGFIEVTVGNTKLMPEAFTYAAETGVVTIFAQHVSGTIRIDAKGSLVQHEAQVTFTDNTDDTVTEAGTAILTATVPKGAVNSGGSFTTRLQAAQGWELPESITVTMNGEELDPGSYTYSQETGLVQVQGAPGM